MASKSDYKAPPALNQAIVYSVWKKELKIWQAFTSLEKKKQAPAIFLTLTGQAREAVLGVDLEVLASDTGVDELIKELDKLYAKDETCTAYEAYETFEKFLRPGNMKMNEYVIKFELLYNKAKSHKMTIDDGVLAYRLLNSANLSENHKELVRATVKEMKYNDMKDQLKKVFTHTSSHGPSQSQAPAIKLETYYNESNTNEHPGNYSNPSSEGLDTYYNKAEKKRWRGRNTQRYDRSSGRGRGQYVNSGRRQNPVWNGEVSRCAVCGSKFHWHKDCPDAYEMKDKGFEESKDDVKHL